MTRQLVDVLLVEGYKQAQADYLVASLLTDGPAEHTIACPRCEGKGYSYRHDSGGLRASSCPDCTNGRQTVIVSAEVKR